MLRLLSHASPWASRIGHWVPALPIALWLIDYLLNDFFPGGYHFDADLGQNIGPGWDIGHTHLFLWWGTPLGLAAGAGCVVMGIMAQRVVTVVEGLWCCTATWVLQMSYTLFVHFS